MARMSEHVKTLICEYNQKGYSTTPISRLLSSGHSIRFTRFAVLAFFKRTRPQHKRIGPVKVEEIRYQALQLWIQENSEQTANPLPSSAGVDTRKY